MKIKISLTILAIFLYMSCSNNEKSHKNQSKSNSKNLTVLLSFDSIPKSEIVVVGSYHFRQENHYDELSIENQEQIENIVTNLSLFNPTKIVIERQIKYDSLLQELYKKYLVDDCVINNFPSETFQLGYRLAKKMGHKRIYLFDNQTEFIGSLENFTWDNFDAYANEYDKGFYDKYKDIIMTSFENNSKNYESLSLYDNITERNSPHSQKWNSERMHVYEVRVGIQDNWMGPDWLGRFYQRNIRMMANVMKYNDPGEDRILIIVGDNHKWILDILFNNNPEFKINSSYELLSN